MIESEFSELASRLSRILPRHPAVSVTGAASLGAQRGTFMIEIGGSGGRTAVAQVSSGPLDVTSVDLEARLIQHAARVGVRVPEVLAWDVEAGVIISERVDGETIPRRILRMTAADETLGRRLVRDCGHSLAVLHGAPVQGFSELPDQSEPTCYVETLTDLVDSLEAPNPSFRLGLRWLARNAPERSRSACLVHGDFRNGNIIVDQNGLAAVLDWELAHLGDPMEDLAWICLRTWRFGEDANEVGGFGRLESLREAYEEAGGTFRPEAFRWWTAARTLWWAVGLARQAKAFVDGDTTSIVLAASGRRVVELEYDLLMEIG